ALHRGQVWVEPTARHDLVDTETEGHEVERAADDVVQIDPGDFALRRPYEPQQPSQELGGTPCLPQDLGHFAPLLTLKTRVGKTVFRVRRDRHEWVIHLVPDPGEQLAGGRK